MYVMSHNYDDDHESITCAAVPCTGGCFFNELTLNHGLGHLVKPAMETQIVLNRGCTI